MHSYTQSFASEYHLRITNPTRRHLARDSSLKDEYEAEVNRILQDVIKSDNSYSPQDFKCPLIYADHIVLDAGDRGDIIKISLTTDPASAIQFQDIAKRFCENCFSHSGSQVVSQLSDSNILGISAIPNTSFAKLWNTAFARSVIKGRQELQGLKYAYHKTPGERRVLSIPGMLVSYTFVIASTILAYTYSSYAATVVIQFVGIPAIARLVENVFIYNLITLFIIGVAWFTLWAIHFKPIDKKSTHTHFAALNWKPRLQSLISHIEETAETPLNDLSSLDKLQAHLSETLTAANYSIHLHSSLNHRYASRTKLYLFMILLHLFIINFFYELIYVPEDRWLARSPALSVSVVLGIALIAWISETLEIIREIRRNDRVVTRMDELNRWVLEILELVSDLEDVKRWNECTGLAEPDLSEEERRLWEEWVGKVGRTKEEVEMNGVTRKVGLVRYIGLVKWVVRRMEDGDDRGR